MHNVVRRHRRCTTWVAERHAQSPNTVATPTAPGRLAPSTAPARTRGSARSRRGRRPNSPGTRRPRGSCCSSRARCRRRPCRRSSAPPPPPSGDCSAWNQGGDSRLRVLGPFPPCAHTEDRAQMWSAWHTKSLDSIFKKETLNAPKTRDPDPCASLRPLRARTAAFLRASSAAASRAAMRSSAPVGEPMDPTSSSGPEAPGFFSPGAAMAALLTSACATPPKIPRTLAKRSKTHGTYPKTAPDINPLPG